MGCVKVITGVIVKSKYARGRVLDRIAVVHGHCSSLRRALSIDLEPSYIFSSGSAEPAAIISYI